MRHSASMSWRIEACWRISTSVKWVITVSDNGLALIMRQANTWSNDDLSSKGKYSINLSPNKTFHFKKCVWKYRLQNSAILFRPRSVQLRENVCLIEASWWINVFWKRFVLPISRTLSTSPGERMPAWACGVGMTQRFGLLSALTVWPKSTPTNDVYLDTTLALQLIRMIWSWWSINSGRESVI